MSLNEDQRKALDSKHTMLYPPILFAEIARHGLDTPNALLNFKNTIDVTYWMQRAKMDLLVGEPSGHYNIGGKIPVTTVYEHTDADREELEKQAKYFVQERETDEKYLKTHFSILRSNISEFCELAINHKDVPDHKLLRKVNQTMRQSGQNPSPSASADLIGGGHKSISKVRDFFDNNRDHLEMLFKVDTLEKSGIWIEKVIYTDTESILHFICQCGIMQLSTDDQAAILNRFINEGKPHINDFAPYARVAMQLYLTIFLYLVENEANPPPQGALRDFEYLYYATDANVTFISGDDWHKKCIEEIPLLKNIQGNFKSLPHINKNEEERKKVLNSLGIKT